MLTPFLFFKKVELMNKNIAIGIDLDGVMAQFDERVLELTGVTPNTLDSTGILWSTLTKYPTFFADLKPYPEMIDLYHEVKDKVGYVRVITGRPRKDSFPAASDHKQQWVREHLDADLDVVVCLSRDKQKHMSKSHMMDILIDDRIDNIARWVEAGGVGILHISAATTRQTLFRLLEL
jgi:5' nucleotidase, deoxy (Pyrimidine), cytosolic type C protein (NT5C)